MGLGEVLRDFANWSTVGGVPHIANSKSWMVRLFWLVVVLSMGGVFVYQLYTMIALFLKFPNAISTVISIEQQKFPAVTICNMNPYKKIGGLTPFDRNLTEFMNYYETVYAIASTVFKQSFQGLATTWERDTRARDVVNMIAAQHKGLYNDSLYQFDEIIADCTFNGFSCSQSNFTEYIDPSYGRCFTFNNDLKSDLSVSRAGKSSGLSLLITVHVVVHYPTEFPSVEGAALTVGVGYTTAVAITAAEYKLAKKPYGTCIDNDSAERNYYLVSRHPGYKYSSLTCYNSCRQRYVYEKCGCHNPRFFGPASASFCAPTPANVACIDGLKGDQYNATQKNMDALIDCACKPPCGEMTYAMTSSMSSFPTEDFIVVADAINATTPVFFETMRKETYEQAASYGEIEGLKKALDDHERLDSAQNKMADKNSSDKDDDDEKPKEKPASGSPKKENETPKEAEKKEEKKEEVKNKEETNLQDSDDDYSDISDSEDEKPKKLTK
ncbi:hypothetical protein PFISCL1PPCAC_22018, partial [Pristionchus fissidentatus]